MTEPAAAAKRRGREATAGANGSFARAAPAAAPPGRTALPAGRVISADDHPFTGLLRVLEEIGMDSVEEARLLLVQREIGNA
jgi:hypothetical protein